MRLHFFIYFTKKKPFLNYKELFVFFVYQYLTHFFRTEKWVRRIVQLRSKRALNDGLKSGISLENLFRELKRNLRVLYHLFHGIFWLKRSGTSFILFVNLSCAFVKKFFCVRVGRIFIRSWKSVGIF